MTMPKNILLVTTMRSGTHLVKTALENYQERRTPPTISDLDLDEINFYSNGFTQNLYVTHFDYLEKWAPGKLDRLNLIIKNRNIYVVFLDRKDFKQLVLSRAIADQLGWQANSKKFKNKIRLKKSNLEQAYKNTVRLKYYNNLDRIPLTVHQKIYYEDVLENGLFINNQEIPMDLFIPSDYKLSVIRNPPKSESITNYDQVLKWMEEFSKVYNEDWVPFIRWG